MNQLEVQGLSKHFGKVVAVASLDLEVHRGEVCILLGPSGCGKSTLLRLVAGLERPTTGLIRLADQDVTGREPRQRNIAMVFQNYALYPHMSVGQNLAFPLRARKVPKPEIEARVLEAARLLGIEDLLARKPVALSGGQRQRVAIGRAIVRRPALFLFDEPLSNLDAQLRARMRVELVQLYRQLEATVLYVTHDQIEAMTLADRIALMNDGRIEQVGTPAEIYDSPASLFAATFVGSPPMNLIPLDGNFEDETGALVRTLSIPTGTATLGVRSEDLAVRPDGPWKAAVEMVENLGAEALVHVRTNGHRLTLRQPGRAAFELGSTIRITPMRAHFFDRQGRRL